MLLVVADKQLDFARLADARHTHLPLARVVGAASSPLAPRRTAFSAPLAPPQHISASTTAGARRQPARLPPLMPLLFLSVCLCVSLGLASRHSLVRTRREIFSWALVPYLHPSVPPLPEFSAKALGRRNSRRIWVETGRVVNGVVVRSRGRAGRRVLSRSDRCCSALCRRLCRCYKGEGL